jgi:hypothetical protein
LPRLGPLEQRSPASSVLLGHYDFRRRIRSCLWIRFPAPLFVSSFTPAQRRRTAQVWPSFYRPVPQGVHEWSNTGSPRFLGSPSRTFAPFSDPGQPVVASPWRPPGTAPNLRTLRTPALIGISELNNAASVLAVYASSTALLQSHARLASGWGLAFAGRDSNPLDSNERFLSYTLTFLLSQVYPGATVTSLPPTLVLPSVSDLLS